MKILFINPKSSGFRLQKAGTASVPQGLLLIATDYKNKGYDINYCDCLVGQEVLYEKYDLVLITVMSSQVPHALEISKKFIRMYPGIQIIWGGVHPTLFNSDIPNIEFFKGQYFSNPEDIPIVDWSILSKSNREKLDIIPILSSIGCPHRCSFCINSITHIGWRSFTVERVLREVEIVKHEFPGKPIRFNDENLFADKQRAMEIIDNLKGIKWETTCRCDYIKDLDLERIAKSGCYKLSFGAESGSQRMLDFIKKDITLEDIIHANLECKKHGIIPEFSFIAGLPTETKGDSIATMKLIKRLHRDNPDAQIIGPQSYRYFAGSELDQYYTASMELPSTTEEWAQAMEGEWSYINPHSDFINSLWAVASYATKPWSKLVEGNVKANILLKLMFMMSAKARMFFDFYDFPIEYILARRVIG